MTEEKQVPTHLVCAIADWQNAWKNVGTTVKADPSVFHAVLGILGPIMNQITPKQIEAKEGTQNAE